MNTPIRLPADVHEGVAPGWWPPAPGWWLLAAMVAALALWLGWRAAHRRRRRNAILGMFDEAVARAGTPSEQVAAMSELLRRAARRQEATADVLSGEDWLRFLDRGMPQPSFVEGAGTLLRDGGFRADVGVEEVAALREVARQRYLSWMQDA